MVIATYNSAKLLPRVLDAIRSQTYSSKFIEILIVDGGSSDCTQQIAEKYGCVFIKNPNVEPVYAKFLGFMRAKSQYVMYIDHDEVLTNNKSIENRLSIFMNNPDVKALTGSGYTTPEGYKIINTYISEYGDPFSFFMYRLTKNADYFIETMRKRYSFRKEDNKSILFEIPETSVLPLIELVACGGMFDAMWVKKEFPLLKKRPQLIPHVFHFIRRLNPYIAIMKNDEIIHYSSDTIKGYASKLVWRIKNNIFFDRTNGASGFSGREKNFSSKDQIKKILFLPYSLIVLPSVIDGILLSFTRKNFAYMIHVPLTIMTGILIVYFYLAKLLGYAPVLKNYDNTREAYYDKI